MVAQRSSLGDSLSDAVIQTRCDSARRIEIGRRRPLDQNVLDGLRDFFHTMWIDNDMDFYVLLFSGSDGCSRENVSHGLIDDVSCDDLATTADRTITVERSTRSSWTFFFCYLSPITSTQWERENLSSHPLQSACPGDESPLAMPRDLHQHASSDGLWLGWTYVFWLLVVWLLLAALWSVVRKGISYRQVAAPHHIF